MSKVSLAQASGNIHEVISGLLANLSSAGEVWDCEEVAWALASRSEGADRCELVESLFDEGLLLSLLFSREAVPGFPGLYLCRPTYPRASWGQVKAWANHECLSVLDYTSTGAEGTLFGWLGRIVNPLHGNPNARFKPSHQFLAFQRPQFVGWTFEPLISWGVGLFKQENAGFLMTTSKLTIDDLLLLICRSGATPFSYWDQLVDENFSRELAITCLVKTGFGNYMTELQGEAQYRKGDQFLPAGSLIPVLHNTPPQL